MERRGRKAVREHHVQGYYGEAHGWETVTVEETMREAQAARRLYDREEPQWRHRVRTVRGEE